MKSFQKSEEVDVSAPKPKSDDEITIFSTLEKANLL
jgi:hypothetical protein